MQAEEEAEMTSYHDKMWRDRISVMQYDSKVDDIDGIFAVCHRADTMYTFNIARHQYHAFIIIIFLQSIYPDGRCYWPLPLSTNKRLYCFTWKKVAANSILLDAT